MGLYIHVTPKQKRQEVDRIAAISPISIWCIAGAEAWPKTFLTHETVAAQRWLLPCTLCYKIVRTSQAPARLL